MPKKIDQGATATIKLLRLFRILLADDSKHFLSDLAHTLNCSSQTVLRLMADIESEVKGNLETGIEKGKRYYRLTSYMAEQLDINAQELRFLSICTDLSSQYVPCHIKKRLTSSIFEMAIQLTAIADRDNIDKVEHFGIIKKGYIDYGPHFQTIHSIIRAMRKQSLLNITYKKVGERELNEYNYVPVRLVSMNNTLYTLGHYYDLKQHSFTHPICFLVHRIHSVESKGHRDGVESLPKIELKGMGLPIDDPKLYIIEFKDPKIIDFVSDRIWADKQKITFVDDKTMHLELISQSEKEVLSFINSFGPGNARLISATLVKEDES
ncbi:Uncharacterised protein [Anaerobiospirillum thomasii]|uniref:WYL domain-containing protein n=1 Tax=Anaerobiospirillum thomasii TaxID=179995 RepID=A0A2X0WQ14_9GAMM|nr:WYL domain-containing protein [Anaerobiospirillum thomasii]SPT67591.1 Uncharacterised protein [Anaerobiospirillum thomasii]SPT68004.1 Uncharacterised protein [Anaerobiospirillum thomasii]SPT70468.1 Uncharacterised protein [Anaerobiospirillum thomasii]